MGSRADVPTATFVSTHWRLESLDLDAASISRGSPAVGRRWSPRYELRTRTETLTLEPDEIVARLTSPDGQVISLPARSLDHIEQSHFTDQAVNPFHQGVSVLGLLREVACHLPAEIARQEGESRLEFACEHEIGRDVVAARAELRDVGLLTSATYAALEPYRPAVVELNLFGDKDDKRGFVSEANQYLSRTRASFVIRGNSIVLHYEAPASPTSLFSLVIDWTRDEGSEVGTICALHPGRVRHAWPSGHLSRHASIGHLDLLERLAVGLPIKDPRQRKAIQAQRRAQSFWWEHMLVDGIGDTGGDVNAPRCGAFEAPLRKPPRQTTTSDSSTIEPAWWESRPR